MTREEAVKIWRSFGCWRFEKNLREGLPQHVVDRAMSEVAEDTIDGLMALGILNVDSPSPQGRETP